MIDIAAVRRQAEAPASHPELLGENGVVVTRAFLRQVAAELAAGRGNVHLSGIRQPAASSMCWSGGMAKPRQPRTLEQATSMLESYSALGARLATIAADRDAQTAAIAAAADKLAEPIVAELQALEAVLEPWWRAEGVKLTKGNRKSMTIGGCEIGTQKSPTSLAIASGDFKAAALLMKSKPWAKPFVTVSYSVDKAATRKALTGPHKAKLAKLGFSEKGGEDQFFVAPIAVTGTIAEPQG